MKPLRRFKQKLEAIITINESLNHEIRQFIYEIDREFEMDATLRKLSERVFSEANLEAKTRSVLNYIETKRVVSRTELSQRFSRSLTSAELYGPAGITEQLLASHLIETKTHHNERSRPGMFFMIPIEKKLKETYAAESAVKDRLSQIVIPDLKDILPAQAFDE
jgi:hypothetical protein